MNHTLSYSEARKNLKECFDKVCTEHVPMLIKRKNASNVVILSEDDYSALEETLYLSSSPKNIARILQAKNREQTKSLSEVKSELGI